MKAILTKHINNYKIVPHYGTIFNAFILMLTSAIAFVYLFNQIDTNHLNQFDAKTIKLFTSFQSPTVTAFMKGFTFIGDIFGYILFVVAISLFFIFKKNWRIALQVSVILILASGLNFFLKATISRPRPMTNQLVAVNFSSFPSGHAMSAIVFYGFIIYLCSILLKNKWLKIMVVSLCVSMILIIGISRIYLGVHYPSDILAGYLAGFSWLMFSVLVLNVITMMKLKKENQ